jgi:hypothetical protein
MSNICSIVFSMLCIVNQLQNLNLKLFFILASTGCITVGGPSPNSACIFPFNHEGNTYFGCPIDPDDSSKRWCSTQTDLNVNHVIGGGHYGECGSSCPIHSGGSAGSSVPGPTNPVSSSCSGNQACRPFTSCSSQVVTLFNWETLML